MASTPLSSKTENDLQRFRELMSQAVDFQKRGDFNAAENLYRRILTLMPAQADALHYLGLLKHQTGKGAEGIALMKKSLEIGMPNSGYLCNLANALKQQGRLDDAITCFRKTLELSPNYAAAWCGLGDAYALKQMPFKACEYFRQADRIDPGNPEVGVSFARALYNTGELTEAVEVCKRHLQTSADDIELIHFLVICLSESGKTKEALQQLRGALARNPLSAILQHAMGVNMAELGNFDEAREYCNYALSLDPLYYQAYIMLTSIRTAAKDDPMEQQLEEKVRALDPEETPRGVVALHFSLGKILQDQGRYETAFTHYLEGNKIMRKLAPYDSVLMTQYFDSIMKHLDVSFLDKCCACANKDDTPIFIMGMPRSGTSLVEQILAAHPEVTAGGELPYLSQSVHQQIETATGSSKGEMIRALNETQLSAIADRYLGKLAEFHPDARHVTDKLPGNFILTGLIRSLFPKARIIHCQRDPLDTCVSCFTTLFEHGQEFSHDLAETGEYYQLYRRMIGHWRELLGSEAMLTIQYEDLITDIESGTHTLLDFCGLEWDPRCLNFNQFKHPVKTASLYQVRQRAYTGSIGRWKNYKGHLEPLRKILTTTV